jgi:hypothetical protein
MNRLKGPIHSKLNCAVYLCKKLDEKLNWVFSSTAQVSHQICQFVVSSVCLLVCVTIVDKNKAVVCCLLATLAIMLSEKKKRKRKLWSKKWDLKRTISCDAHLLNELLESDTEDYIYMMPPWCRQVNWGNSGIPWVNCAVLCVKDDWKGQFWGLRYCLSKMRSLLRFFRQAWRHKVKSLSLTESV